MSDPIQAIFQRHFEIHRGQICGMLCAEICMRSISLEIERRGFPPDSVEAKLIEVRMDELRKVGETLIKHLGEPMFIEPPSGTLPPAEEGLK